MKSLTIFFALSISAFSQTQTLTPTQAAALYQPLIGSGALAPSKLSQAGATTGQVLTWSGSAWAAANSSGGGGGNLTSGPVTSSSGVSAIADGALAIAKTSGLQTALDAKISSVITNTNNNFVFEGDSETAGGALSAGQDFPAKVMLTSMFSGKGTKYNVATGGALLSSMITEYASQVYPKRPAANGGAPAYLFIWSGANDIGVVSAATEISNLESYWATAKADGFTVIAFTVMRESAYSQAGEADRQTINSAIRKSTTYDYLVDTASLFPDPLDTNFFLGDGIHLSAAANLVLAREIQSVLLSKSGSKRADVTSTKFISGPLKMGVGNMTTAGDVLALANAPTSSSGNTNFNARTEWTPSSAAVNTSASGVDSQVFVMGSNTTDAATNLIPYLATSTYRASGGGIGGIYGFATHIGNQADLYGGSGQAVTDLRHFDATSPITSGTSAPITTATGYYIEPQKVTGVGVGYGIYQAGTNDINLLTGTTKSTGLLIAKKGYGAGTAFQIDAGSGVNEYNLNIKPYVVGAYDIGYQFNLVNNYSDAGNPLTITSAGVIVKGTIEGSEQTAPAAPPADGYRIFAVDNGSGKTVLKVQFATGAAQIIATQP